MADKKYLDTNGTSVILNKIKGELDKKVDSNRNMSATEAGIAKAGNGLEVNNGDVLAVKAKSGGAISVTADGVDVKTATTTDYGTVKVDSAISDTSTNPVQNKVVKTELDRKVTKETGKGLSTNDFTDDYKTKLDGIESGANNTVVDSSLSDTSENPVQNKVVKSALDNKVDKNGTDRLITAEEAEKLGGIEANANKYELPNATSTTKGGVIVGDNIDVTDGKISVGKASKTAYGVVKVGGGILVDNDGVISVDVSEGTFDYDSLDNRPSINSHILSGNQSASALGLEGTDNKVTFVSDSSTDTQYPSAKAVYTALSGKQDNLDLEYLLGTSDGATLPSPPISKINSSPIAADYDISGNPISSTYVKNAALDTFKSTVTAIAEGKCKTYVFDYVSTAETGGTATNGKTYLDTFLAKASGKYVYGSEEVTLNIGDVFLIRNTSVPDYWWDGTAKQELEVNLIEETEAIPIGAESDSTTATVYGIINSVFK